MGVRVRSTPDNFASASVTTTYQGFIFCRFRKTRREDKGTRMDRSGAMQETVGEDIQVFIVNKIQEKNIHRNI